MAKTSYFIILTVALILATSKQADGSIVLYGLCQAGCAGVVVACFAAAGVTFGTVPATLIAATPALAACNTAYAACYSACAATLLVPAP